MRPNAPAKEDANLRVWPKSNVRVKNVNLKLMVWLKKELANLLSLKLNLRQNQRSRLKLKPD
jgi:hypothetical protein